MKIIETELNIVRENIKDGQIDVLPNRSVANFVFGSKKMIRSQVSLLYYLSQEKFLNDDIYKILSAVEILHNASLLHDDVIDEAFIRRGKTTIAKEYSDKISILTGDYLILYAFEKLLHIDNEIQKIFHKYTKKIIEAEIKQQFSKNQIISPEEYINICRGKTASLFILSLESIAKFLNADINKCQKFGEQFGIAFQIKNDLEKTSAEIDSKNKIFTAKDVMGIEKTVELLDNYKEELLGIINDIPNNIYKRALEDLIKDLCTIEKS